MTIRVGHLYPDYLNIYADRGNIAVLDRRAAWRGLELEVTTIGLGETLAPDDYDLLYIGGGQDREQALIAHDIATKAPALADAVSGGTVVLAVCGGYQLLGRFYRDRDRCQDRQADRARVGGASDGSQPCFGGVSLRCGLRLVDSRPEDPAPAAGQQPEGQEERREAEQGKRAARCQAPSPRREQARCGCATARVGSEAGHGRSQRSSQGQGLRGQPGKPGEGRLDRLRAGQCRAR